MPELSTCLISDSWHSFEYVSGIKYAEVLNMPWYSYNNIIIIVTKIVILEFLPARFIHSGFPQLKKIF